MPRSRLDRILACSDPFSLAESIDAYVHTLDAGRLRTLLVDARDRLGPYYRGEIAGILDGGSFAGLDSTHYTEIVTRYHSAESLQRTLVAFLKSNLRAIMIFGAPFAAAVVGRLQSRGAVAIGEERPRLFARGAIVAVSALALIAGGAAGERYITQARLSSAALPEPNMAAAQPPPIAAPAATSSPRPKPNRLAAVPAAQPAPAPNRSPAPPESTTRLAPVPLRAQASPQPSPQTPPPTPIPAATIAPTTAPTPTPEPSPLDLTDMPESYSDATPLPEQSVRPAAPPPPHLRVATPKPSPSPHRSWIQRTLNHLDPFKPSAPKPSPSPR